MPKLVILGSSYAIPGKAFENTHMALIGKERSVLIDCVGSPIQRLEEAGVDHQGLTDLILTHFHPDHVSGVPLLLMGLWLLGRHARMDIHGLQHAIERAQKMMALYDWESWPGFFPVKFHRLPEAELTPVIESSEFRILSSPVRHIIPTIGLRVEFAESKKVLAYSCDTEPCQQVVQLAEGADVLIHEASGASFGHSSAAQAAEIARKAEVGKLYLIHYPTRDFNPKAILDEASQYFSGPIALANDFMELDF